VGAVVGSVGLCVCCIIAICCACRHRRQPISVMVRTPLPVEEVTQTTVTTINNPAPVTTNTVVYQPSQPQIYAQPIQPQIYAQPGQTIYSQPMGGDPGYSQVYGNIGVPNYQVTGTLYSPQDGAYPQGQGVYSQPGMAPPDQVYQAQM